MIQNMISNFNSLSEKELMTYAGKWVAIIDNRVIFNSSSFREVYNYSKEKFPKKRPLIGKIPAIEISIL